MMTVYKLYGRRNDLVHGNKQISISDLELQEYYIAFELLFKDNLSIGKFLNIDEINENLLNRLPL